MNISSHKKQVSDLIVSFVGGRRDADILFVGSLRATAERMYHPTLSDIDVLIVPKCDSLSDYVSHIERAMKMAALLNRQEGWLTDVFFMSCNVATAHYSCLAVYAGDIRAREADFIVNNRLFTGDIKEPNPLFKKKLYAAYAKRLRDHYRYTLPISDTRYAKQTAKRLLRLLKLIVCAYTDIEHIDAVESELFIVTDFTAINPLFRTATGHNLRLDEALDRALHSEEIEDWPALMREQYEVSRVLSTLDLSDVITESEAVIFGDMGWLLRDLLLVRLKNILTEADPDKRVDKIERYVNDGLSVIVRLALSGVVELVDMTTKDTPEVVQESYTLITKYIQDGRVSQRHIAAMTVMLEYAFSCGFSFCHRILKNKKNTII